MTPNEKSMIEELFGRIRQTSMPTRDAEAERLIAEEMARTPGAAYALAQTVLVQDQALRQAADQVQALQEAAQRAQPDRDGAPQSGSFLDRFGGPGARPGAVPRTGQAVDPQAAPPPPQAGGFGGGGFLSGALQTAAGVAGGALLFEGVRSLFGGSGGLGGAFGSGPWGGGTPTINETIINEAPDKGADDSRDDRDDDGLRQASDSDDDDGDPADDGWSDDGFDGDDSI